MRLFRKGSSRTDQGDDSGAPISEKENSPNLSGLFVDSPAGTETYVSSPQEALAAGNLPNPNESTKMQTLVTSPLSLGESQENFRSPPSDSERKNEDLEIVELSLELTQHGSITDEPKSAVQNEPSMMKLQKIDSFGDEPSSRRGVTGSDSPIKSPARKFSDRASPRKPPLKQSPKLGGSSRFPLAKEIASIEGFEAALEDDETFMIEEATRRDIRMLQTGAAADIETASVLFKKRKGKKEDGVMSAEEILRTQRWGRSPSKRPPTALPAFPDSPGRRSRGKRPPPLIQKLALPADSPTSSGLNSNVFGGNGEFRTGGFNITADGILHKPNLDLREDEVKTLRGGDNFSGVAMGALKEFKNGPTIGQGAAGRVYLALHEPTSTAVAMKTVNVFDQALRNQLTKELNTLSRYISRYLVRFYGAFYDKKGSVHIALEFMDRGCLDSFVRKNGAIPEHVVRVIAVDCLRGLRFLHKHHVLHRDFKTANILISREQCCAKISDFGLAREKKPDESEVASQQVKTFVGTLGYMSPERVQGNEYTYASDIWALGVSLAECFLGGYPFTKSENYFDYMNQTFTKSSFDSVGKDDSSKMSSEAIDFILVISNSDPTKRPTAEEALKHPWLKDFVPNKEDRMKFGSWIDEVARKKREKRN